MGAIPCTRPDLACRTPTEENDPSFRLMTRMGYGAAVSEPKIGPEVIDACRLGDREALRLIFEAYKDRVYSMTLYFFKGDEATACDVTQQVFVKLMTAIAQFRHESDFSTWLYRLVTNACIDRHRQHRNTVPLDDHAGLTHHQASQELEYARQELAHSVQAALAGLNPKLRVALLLRYFDDLSYDEMAVALHCSKGTVASRLNRAHQALARKLAHLKNALVEGA